MKKKFRTIFIRCSCYNEVLAAHYDYEIDSLDLSLYQTLSSYKHKKTIYQYIRDIIRILWTGEPYTDQIVLDRKNIEELKSFINQI